MLVRVRGVEQTNAALALLQAIGKRTVRNVQDTTRGTIYFVQRGKAVSSQRIVDEVERQIDQQITRAGL